MLPHVSVDSTKPVRSPESRALVGRGADLARVAAAIDAGERLVTILGPPGIGKTSLAHHAAERLAPRYGGASRTWFVDLSTSWSEADLCYAVVSALAGRAREMPAATPANVSALLAERGPALVVLDNFEQLVAAADLLPAWLRAAPEAALVVTSRERLAVDGEHVLELMPLRCPRPGAGREEVIASEAVQLFRARARDVGARPSDDADAIAAIVRRLDGIPLAIEIAASRTRLLSPAELAARLGRGEDVLAAASKRSHERHRTLDHAIAWSWGLLTEDEQIALASASVFPASFALGWAEAVVGAALGSERRASRPPVIELVAALREKSLVHAAEDDRLALYVSVREFAAKRLAERGLAEVVKLAHARFFADLARRFNASHLLQDETLEPGLRPAARREKANLAAALAFVSSLPASRTRAELRTELAAAVAFLAAVPAALMERETAALLGDGGELTPHETALVLLARQHALHLLGRYEEAITQTERIAALPGVSPGMASFALANTGVLLRGQGDAHAAWAYHERAARLLEGDGSFPRVVAMNTACMGRLQCDLADLEQARTLNLRSVELADRLGDRWLAALGLANLAQLEQENGNFERAEDLVTRALARFRETDEPQYQAIYASMCGALYFEWGKPDLARRSYVEGEAVLDALKAPFARVVVLGGRAAFEAMTGHLAEASAHLDLARRDAARAPGSVARLIVEAHEGTLELLRAPAAHTETWRHRLEDLASGRGPDAALIRSNIDLRFAVRILSRALARRSADHGGTVLVVAPDTLSFSVDGRPPVDLARRGSLRRILAALSAERAAHPGRTLAVEALSALGWPNERILAEAASTRVRVAIATLRKLGLRDVLLTRDDGYLLDPRVRIERA